MQTLPSRLKFTLAEEVMTVAYRITEQESQQLLMDESTYYFKTVLHIIDSAMLPNSNVEGVTSSSTSSIVKIDVLKVKINAQLVLSLIRATPSEMLCSLKQRMKNDASTEVGTFSHVRIPDK
jgi:hypothetical protein